MNYRWFAGSALLAGLAVMLTLNLFSIGSHWSQIRTSVTTPPGMAAPDFTLPLLDGKELHLAAEQGQPVVLAFWASWCGPCKRELPHLDRLYQRDRDRARFFAVNIEDASMKPTVEAYVKSAGLTLPVAFGGEQVANTYRVATIPHLVIVDRAGKVHRVLDGLHDESDLSQAIDDAIAAP